MKPSKKAVIWPIDAALGRAHESYSALKRCTQHTAAVHREGGNEIE
jgi:hypothetical protein